MLAVLGVLVAGGGIRNWVVLMVAVQCFAVRWQLKFEGGC